MTENVMFNADLTAAVYMRSAGMPWIESPSKLVLRKRFFLRGPPEAGQVTSLVRYLPGAEFPEHPHPDGEEIVVLEGVFSDHTGDWPPGSWLLNPEGFRHSPFSRPGCLLFVKLRQYTGRQQLGVEAGELRWSRSPEKVLFRRDTGSTRIVSLAPGERRVLARANGLEGFLLDGQARVQGWSLSRYDWFRLPSCESAVIESGGCTLYIDEDCTSRLDSGVQ